LAETTNFKLFIFKIKKVISEVKRKTSSKPLNGMWEVLAVGYVLKPVQITFFSTGK